MNYIKKIKFKTAVITNITTIIVAIIVHLFVIVDIIPFTWINGGRSISLFKQQKISIFSIIILILMIIINIMAYKKFIKFGIFKFILWLLFGYSIIGMIMQVFGTTFEKTCMSILCAINIIMYYRLASEKIKP